jgi:signal transduction histidine kinase
MKPKWFSPNLVAAPTARNRWLAYAVSLVGPTAVLLLVWVLEHGAPAAPLYPLFTLTIVLSALLGGLYPGLLALAVSLFYTDYLILPPRYSLLISDRRELLRFAAFAVVGVVVSVLIAALRRKREEVARSDTQLRTIVNNLIERLYVCDGSGRPLVVNEAFSAFYPIKELVYPQSFSEAVELFDLNGQPLPLSDWPISRALRGEQVQGLELRIRSKKHPGMEFIHTYNASPVRDAQGNVIMAVVTAEDITLQKQSEQALIRSEKLAATGRMAATIAHEVNNPLEAAMSAVYLALLDQSLAHETRNTLMVADQELRRAAHITGRTLGFYREHNNRTHVSLPTVIDDVLAIYATKLQHRGVTVHRRYKCGPCTEGCEGCFLINAGELRQIISNLLANGMDALRDHGTMYIRVSRASSLKEGGPNIHLTIADNGCGIRTENLKRIFEPFFTTKESVGTGLGLWVTQELVRKHNGTIKVRSRKDKGTVFRIAFPATILAPPIEAGSSSREQVPHIRPPSAKPG